MDVLRERGGGERDRARDDVKDADDDDDVRTQV